MKKEKQDCKRDLADMSTANENAHRSHVIV